MSRFKREREAGAGNEAPPSVFIQPITEKAPNTLRDTITCSKTGFPSTKLNVNLGIASRAQPKTVQEIGLVNDHMEDYQKENMQKVMSMSEKEVQDSLASISTMFSAASLDFLKQRGLRDLQHTATHPTAAPAAIPTNQRKPEKKSASLPPVQPEDVIATSLEELQLRQKQAPPEVQARLAWTLDEPEASNDTAENDKQRQFASEERFDLYGNKIIVAEHMFAQIRKLIFPTPLASTSDSLSLISSMLTLCIDSGGLARDKNTYAMLEDQPQNELRHHETDTHLLGYTIREACELIRSDVPSQRAIGLRIINGALQRRQFIVDLEAYYASSQICDSHLFRPIREAAAAVIASGVSPRVLVFALLKLVATDFAPELPSVITHRLLCHPQSRQLHNNMLELQCLQYYLFSDCENRASDILWSGSDSLAGVPPLLMPHSRRSEMAYEAYVIDCVSKRNAIVADDGKDKDEPPMHFIEAFALSCRWHRVEAIFSEPAVASVLQYHIRDSIELVLVRCNDTSAMESAIHGVAAIQILIHAARCISSSDIIFNIMKQLWTKGNMLMHASMISSHTLAQRLTKLWLQFIGEVCRHSGQYAAWANSQEVTLDLFALLSQVSHPDIIVQCVRVWRVVLAYGDGIGDIEELLAVVLQRWTTFTSDEAVIVELYHFLAEISKFCSLEFSRGGEAANSCIGIARSLVVIYQTSLITSPENTLCRAALMLFNASLLERQTPETSSGLRESCRQYIESLSPEGQSEASVVLYDTLKSLPLPSLGLLPCLETNCSWEESWERMELIYASIRVALAVDVCDSHQSLQVLTSLVLREGDAVCYGLFRWKMKLLIQMSALLLIEGTKTDCLEWNKAIVCAIPLMYQENKKLQLQQVALEQLRPVLNMDEASFLDLSTSLFPIDDAPTVQSSPETLLRSYATPRDEKRNDADNFLYSLLLKLPTQYTRSLLLHTLNTEDGSRAGGKIFALCELLHADNLSQRCLYDNAPYHDCIDAYGELMLLLCQHPSQATAKEFMQCVLRKHGASSNLSAGVDVSSKRNLDMLLEYVSSMIATITSQYTLQEIHSISMIPLLLPSFLPWRCRQLIWKELGEWSLLHVLDSPLWLHLQSEYMQFGQCSFMTPTLAQSLAHLRRSEDRYLPIVALGYWEMASAFAVDTLTGSNARLLENIIEDSVTYPDDMLRELLVYVSLIRSSRNNVVATRLQLTCQIVDIADALQVNIKSHERSRTVQDLLIESGRNFA